MKSSFASPLPAVKGCNTSKSNLRPRALLFGRDRKGFTLVELIVVILILGVLATIAIMLLLSFKQRGYEVTLASDLSSAYRASAQYHLDHSTGTATLDILMAYGFRPSKDVNVNIIDGSAENLNMTAIHPGFAGVYQVDHQGYVSQQ